MGVEGCRGPLHDSSELPMSSLQGWQSRCVALKKMLEGSSDDASLRSPSREPGFLLFQCLPDVVCSLTGEDVIVFTSKVTSFPEPPHSS